ncbi:methyl-accepting chemotaxis protein [uncultured Cedecea sp.]|uniref:methyl-accepting chemotaxis protein n=1 Tax=uncultured Cedecea sp. TaxID=988762 RepID=UPI002633FEA1|nr:methyl-accepting chemotaxis protein [uncultured Cedecea sp.]
MSITKKLYALFSLLVSSLIALVIVVMVVITGMQERFQYVQDNVIESLGELNQLVDSSNGLTIWLYRHQSSKDLQKQTEIEKNIDEQINKIESISNSYLENNIYNEQDRVMMEDSVAYIKKIRAKLPIFIKGSREQNDAVSLGQLQQPEGVGSDIRELISNYQEHFKLNDQFGSDFNNKNLEIYKLTFWGLIIGSVLTILIIGMFAVIVINGIKRSLLDIKIIMEMANANLDLTCRADDHKNDEIGHTARAFNNLISRVADSLISVSASAQSVSSASSQIASGNEDLSSRTEEQAASLEQTAASMAELNETVRQTAENTTMASQLSQNAMHFSNDSNDKVQKMMVTMDAIKESSSKITAIISMIEGVAFQTNILALNAAVEAARAGEQGRGFAVVAGEVRNLAQRSSSSAREIKELIESSLALIETGVSQAGEVNHNMIEMDGAIRQVSDLVDEIASAANEQALGITQVHQAVSQMDDVTQQNAALVEQASSASRSLMEQAVSLNQLVSEFIVGKDATSGSTFVEKKQNYSFIKRNASDSSTNIDLTNNDADWKSF